MTMMIIITIIVFGYQTHERQASFSWTAGAKRLR